jgi:hypothetical protein
MVYGYTSQRLKHPSSQPFFSWSSFFSKAALVDLFHLFLTRLISHQVRKRANEDGEFKGEIEQLTKSIIETAT